MKLQMTKRKQLGGKKRSSTVDTKSPKRAKKTEYTQKECELNGFEIIGGKTEKFLAFVSERGKCNEMSNANMIKRNLMIINKNVCAIAQFFECQKKWLDQLNVEETDEDQLCEMCFKHYQPFNVLKGMTGRPPA